MTRLKVQGANFVNWNGRVNALRLTSLVTNPPTHMTQASNKTSLGDWLMWKLAFDFLFTLACIYCTKISPAIPHVNTPFFASVISLLFFETKEMRPCEQLCQARLFTVQRIRLSDVISLSSHRHSPIIFSFFPHALLIVDGAPPPNAPPSSAPSPRPRAPFFLLVVNSSSPKSPTRPYSENLLLSTTSFA